MRRIEFVGVPGSGKSTLYREAHVALRQRGVPALTIEDVLYRWGRGAPRDRAVAVAGKVLPGPVLRRVAPRLFARSEDKFVALSEFLTEHGRVLEAVVTSQGRRDRGARADLAVYWTMNLFAYFQIASRSLHHDEVLVVDEGFTQRVTTLFAWGLRADDDPILGNYVSSIPRPDVLVWVEAPLEVCADRLAKRGGLWRCEGMDPETGAARGGRYLEDCQTCIERAVADLRARGVDVVRVQNRGPREDASRALRLALDERWSTGAPAVR